MEYKKITLIIIANNNIEKCLDNISKQSYIKDIEIMFLYKKENEDNINNLKQKYNNLNINYIITEKNIFATIKKNENLITGFYISILNSEDTLTIDYYRTMCAKASEKNSDIVISNAILNYLDGGKAYLNLSEASLKELNGKNVLDEYFKMSTVSFLWNIYSNKIYTKELFFKAVNEIYKINNYIQNFYFFTIMFYYASKINIVENEMIFYSFEQNVFEATRKLLSNKNLDTNENLYLNTEQNFNYIEEFLNKNNINIDFSEFKEIYLKNETELKKDILQVVKTAWNDNLENLKKEIMSPNTQIVSFDIFDTLVLRPFWSPIDLFTFLNKEFRELSNIETGMDFSKIRVEAERSARTKLCNKPNIQDITLDQIYEEIKNITKIDEEIIKKLKAKEQELEIRFCTKRKTAKEIYDLAKYLNKKVICISDMYLPIDTIKKIVEKNGYNLEKIYLSSEIKLTKFTGDIYKYALDDLKIEGNKIVHIGDNYYSDYEQAKKQKINAMFLPKASDVFLNENITNALGMVFTKNIPMWQDTQNGLNFLGIRVMLALVANKYFDNPYKTFNNQTDFNADPNLIGYYALGMHLFGVTNWLIKDLIKENYDNIVFFARDGYWVMKAYEILKKCYIDAPEEKYLYISRRAIIPITINNRMDFFKLSELIDIYKYTPKTILKYIKNILSNLENLEEECKLNDIDCDKKFESKTEFNNYINLIIDKFYDKEKHTKIKKNLKQYFSKKFSQKTSAFDIGYSAKPELYLTKLCDKQIDTYFLNISNEEALQNSKLGGFNLKTYFENRPAITGVVRESLMSTADLSCIGYDFDENENVIPLFEERKEFYQERFVFDAMQNKAIEFIKDIVSIFKDDINELYYQKYYISLPHEMYINSPKQIDQEIFYGIYFEDSVGLGEKIPAIEEWNNELNAKNQKRTTELFNIELTKNLQKEIEDLNNKINKIQEEKDKIINEKESKLNEIYNSKKWKAFEKIDEFLGRKN